MAQHSAPMCMWCAHFYEELSGFKCEAFPGGIPEDIYESRFDHREPHPDDKGIQFELAEDAGEDRLNYIENLYSEQNNQAKKDQKIADMTEIALKNSGDMPEEALEGLCESLGEADGFFTRCMDHHVTDDMDDPESFCAWLHHYCHGKWPAEDAD